MEGAWVVLRLYIMRKPSKVKGHLTTLLPAILSLEKGTIHHMDCLDLGHAKSTSPASFLIEI